MKVAILGTRGIPAKYGGFETFAEELAVRLARQGIDVTVYCKADNNQQPGTYKGVHLVYIPSFHLGPLTTIWFDLLCLWHARNKFDIVYMLGYGASIVCFIPRLWGNRVWLNMDGIEWARSKWGTFAKLWFKCMETVAMYTPNQLIADADGIKEHLQSRHKHMPPCSVIPYGAYVSEVSPPVDLLREWKLYAKAYYLVVCRLEPENSVSEVIEGFIASGSSYPLVIVGDHTTRTPYVECLLRLKDDRIRFIGTVYDTLKLQALRSHSLAYFHGHTAGGTNPSLLEALGCGNMVIAHDNRFNREVAGDIALYFTGSHDIPGIIKKIELYSSHEQEGIADKAKRRVQSKYHWDDITAKYMRLIADEPNVSIPDYTGGKK
ncbi:MAG: glycosyltransferase family 1 protein [Candidatus Jettenia sp.]|uniref:Glycosyltransferase n=1 Tax=Candidatus Jettenia caeni TaxID=247490 RepID=I3IQV4_9BACT|nr:DUF1972 domain-containing protein [Candidatus Jettenia sp. AMX1]MBC6928187.1 glycosyltransferase family 1 protein [Candidatus Jettenia sp.]WKZ15403.1 MAG: DUF1972 domain-containing protein [Candidatus Jettenia caeni]KAA0249006.1 MAG: glycosyltransferase family 1 protein [Candidatus Jettenia sp. AMX1]MCE7879576.1 glycosyltransferase family 1 protein [Candidatus Jettenia sp. AMX1]MCQ3926935.1 glycosyltransferase family 1 protein [Candidatus Jettenia sp.]